MASTSAGKQRKIAAVAMSVAGLALLIWHLVDPGRRVDGWSVALFVLVFLPWLGPVFESITFPGGGGVKYQQLEAKLELQEQEIKSLQFLVANFLTGDETKYLRIFASSDPFTFGHDDDSRIAFQAVERLKHLGFVAGKTDLNPAALVGSDGNDLKIMFEITDLGLEYLKLRDNTSSS